MPVTNIYATANKDGYIQVDSSLNFLQARNAVTGTVYNSVANHSQACQAQVFTGRGSATYRIKRSFFYFDVSSVSAATSATINIRGITYNSGDIIGVKASVSDPLAGADFDSISGWTGPSDTDQEPNVTKFTDEVTTWTTSGYNTIPLLSAAVTHINSNSRFIICFLKYDYDLKGVDSTGATDVSNGMYYMESSASYRPYIAVTTPDPTVDNAIFFGTNF